MANLNKVMLIGRLATDPDPIRTFPSGGAVTRFRFAVNYNRRKNQQTGQWEGDSTFIDVEAFNSSREGGRQLADLVFQYLKKGHQLFVEGRLRLNEWTDKDGQKRSKIVVVADSIEFLEPRSDSGGGEEGRFSRSSAPARKAPAPAASADNFDEGEPESYDPNGGRGGTSDIPF